MEFAELVHDYGYYAVVVGTFFEGEIVIIAAGIAASAGILSLPAVILASMAGIFASDTSCFLFGRFAGGRIKSWFPALHARLDGIFRAIERHNDKILVFFQFLPGFCTVTPIAFGMTRISTARFMAFGFAGNALWTLVFTLGGYVFGAAFKQADSDKHYWAFAVCAAIIVGGGMVMWRVTRSLRNRIVRVSIAMDCCVDPPMGDTEPLHRQGVHHPGH